MSDPIPVLAHLVGLGLDVEFVALLDAHDADCAEDTVFVSKRSDNSQFAREGKNQSNISYLLSDCLDMIVEKFNCRKDGHGQVKES